LDAGAVGKFQFNPTLIVPARLFRPIRQRKRPPG
jgi:hypothetical protein